MSKKSGSFNSSKNQESTAEKWTTGSHDEAKGSIPSLNDNSNPQQGTGGNRANTNLPANTPEANKALAAQQRVSLSIPPTVKDPRKLFVGGLPSDVTGEEFRCFFEEYGPVVESVILIDHCTMNSRGFGFVTMADESIAHNLIQMGRVELKGKLVEIKAAEPKGKVAATGPSVRKSDRRVNVATTASPSVSFDHVSLTAMGDTTLAPVSYGDALIAPTVSPYGHPYNIYPGPVTSLDTSHGLTTPSATGTIVPLIGTYYPTPTPPPAVAGPMMPFSPYASPYYPPIPYEPHYPNATGGTEAHGYGPVYYEPYSPVRSNASDV